MRRSTKSKKANKKAAKKTVKKKAAKKAISRLRGRAKPMKKSITFAHRPREMYLQQDIQVQDASYLHDNVLSITFNNGTTRTVDFGKFFAVNQIPYLNKYRSQRLFKSFKIEDGNIVWGKDWDLIFPIKSLYSGRFS